MVANVLTRLFLSAISTTLISAQLKVSFAAFFASLLVLYFPLSSIHGRVSSIFTHTVYKFFTVQSVGKGFRV